MSTSYKRLSFTNEEEERLIEFIKHHPALWDANHREYGNGELRKIYWKSIAVELKKSVLECRRKWRFIRDYYIHKRRRLTDSTRERDGKYFSLHFLDKVSIRKFTNNPENVTKTVKSVRKNIDKIDNVKEVFEDPQVEYSYAQDVTFEKVTMERMDQSNDCALDDNDDAVHNDLETNNDEAKDYGMANDDFSFDESTIIHEFPFEQKLEHAEEEEEEHLIETQSEPEPEVEPTKQTPAADVSMHERSIDLFFESMAAVVKTFPPHIATEAKFKVFIAVNALEMKVHKNEK